MELSLLHRKEGIIISTIEAMNKVGIDNLSTKRIAEFQGVSEGTIFRHFKNKTEIMQGVLEYFCQFDNDIIQASANRKLNPIEAIAYFSNAFAEYYQNYPDITIIALNLHNLQYDPELADYARSIIEKRNRFICYEVKKAQYLGILNNTVEADIIAGIIGGSFKELCMRWRMENYEFSLKDKSSVVILTILDAFTIKGKQGDAS